METFDSILSDCTISLERIASKGKTMLEAYYSEEYKAKLLQKAQSLKEELKMRDKMF